eukprot:TRINITY_DN5844_c0_g1_i2.p1 TRINITY_DN5844_c0_g1~~TRINITY_DN5844_c0_g1_i2.p1  ORF type:complete len:524 (-),score=98.85 TRINITY_DN5844_c0_g1_i2:81-1586(-)
MAKPESVQKKRDTSPAPKAEAEQDEKEKDGSVKVNDEGEQAPVRRPIQFRWVMCWLLFGCRMVCQANRILLGALLPAIRKDVGFTDAETGSLLSAFASGYMLTQIIGGVVADRLGGKWMLQLAINSVTLGSLVAPFAIDRGFWPAYCTYFLMGLMEGPSFPTSGSMLSKWITASERATAASLADTGGSIGGLVALGGGPILATQIGWRSTFAVYGLSSAVFCVIWLVFSSSRPNNTRFVSPEELEHLMKEGVVERPVEECNVAGATPAGDKNKVVSAEPSKDASDTDTSAKKQDGSVWKMLREPPVLAVCYAHSVFNFGRYFLYGWIPTYYSEVLGVPAVTAGFYMTCLQVADAFVKLLVAPIADRLTASGYLSILGIRRLLSCSAFIGFGAGLGFCGTATSPVWATVALVAAKSTASCHAAGFKTNYLDITKKHTGTIAGVGNTLATLSSMIAPLTAGAVIQASGWSSMFTLCFFVNLSGAVVFGLFSSATNLDPVDKSS